MYKGQVRIEMSSDPVKTQSWNHFCICGTQKEDEDGIDNSEVCLLLTLPPEV